MNKRPEEMTREELEAAYGPGTKNPDGSVSWHIESDPVPEPAAGPAQEVKHPSYYNLGKVECADAMESAAMAYGKRPDLAVDISNVIKYVWRAPAKSDLKTDLLKAREWLDRAIQNA